MPHTIITGGSSGIGFALAGKLAVRGYRLSLIARRPQQLEAAAHAIAINHPQRRDGITAISADVADRAAAYEAIHSAIGMFGPPDLLITSAGIAIPGRFLELADEVFEQTMAANYFGTLWCVRAALPAMVRAGRGRVHMVSSGAGLVGAYGYTPYAPTKFALRGLAEALRQEFKPKGIAVSISYPPDTDTPQLAAENATKPEETKRMTGIAKIWSADRVADCILEGIDRNRVDIPIGATLKFLATFSGPLMPLIRWHVDGIVQAVAREERRGAGSRA
jgi:3-dehydrosphinganine reductase